MHRHRVSLFVHTGKSDCDSLKRTNQTITPCEALSSMVVVIAPQQEEMRIMYLFRMHSTLLYTDMEQSLCIDE
jgi:hypothetical protein